MDSYTYLNQKLVWPIDMSKEHNYLLVDDPNYQTHYLDRYAETATTLCGKCVETTEIKWDSMDYSVGVGCGACYEELHRRVLA